MTTAVFIDCQPVRDSFRQWHADQDALDAQVAESFAALEAYQSHLDAWQQNLVQERDELRQMRANLEHDRKLAGSPGEQSDEIRAELGDARQKITSLTSALLTRTEELRELDRLRVHADSQLHEAQVRAKELTAALDAQRSGHTANARQPNQQASHPRDEARRGEVSTAAAQPAVSNGKASGTNVNPAKPTNGSPQTNGTKSANPVLGSVMEQFGKLRQQRSLGRQNNPKPR